MPCSIQLRSANLIVPAGQVTATLLRVIGEATQCLSLQVRVKSSITDPAGAVTSVDPNTGRFRADLPITASPPPGCGDPVDLLIECVGNEAACNLVVNDYLTPCCEFPTFFFDAESLPGSLTPDHLRVSGTAEGCPDDEVVVTSSITAPSGTLTADPITGAFSTKLPILKPTDCATTVDVTVECASSGLGCRLTRTLPLTCIGCFRAAVSASSAPCTGTPAKQPFTFSATVAGIPAGTTTQFEWLYGDGTSSGPIPISTPAGGTPNTQYPLPPFTHLYTPGTPATYTATLRLYQNTECNVVPITVAAQCGGACPTITINPPSVGQCVLTKRQVTLTAQVVPVTGQPTIVEWDFGDGQTGTAQSVTPTTPLPPESHDYTPPGPFTPSLHIIFPPGCPPVSGTPLTLAPCDDEPCDLTVVDTDLVLTPGACNPDGTRTVSGTITISNPDPADRYLWQWTSAPVTGTGLTSAQGGTQQTHPYAAGSTYTVKVTVRRGDDCQATATRQVTLDPCTGPCPQFTAVTAVVGACAAGSNRREVTLTAQVSGAIGQYVWTFGDGTPDATTTAPTFTHLYGPGTFTASVSATPAGCPPTQASTAPFSVPVCCSQFTGVTAVVGNCTAGSSTREVTLTAQTSGAISGPYTWTFGDGSPNGSSPGPTITHAYAAGAYTATVSATSPGCPPTTASTAAPVTVAACPPVDGGGGGGGGGGGLPNPACSVWCVIAGMLFIAIPISAFISTVAHCLVFGWNIPLQAGIIAVAMGIFIALCGVCCLWVFLLIGSGLGIVATLIASYWLGFPACWYFGLPLLIGFIALGLGIAADCARRQAPPPPPPAPNPPAAAGSSALTSLQHERAVEAAPPAGLGDVIKQATEAVGIRPCAGCRDRADRLNALVPFGDRRSLPD